MKSPKKSESSGSSTGTTKVPYYTIKSGLKKYQPRSKKAIKSAQPKTVERLRRQNIWNAFFDLKRDDSADNKVEQVRLLNNLKGDNLPKEVEEGSMKDAGILYDYDVKGLMAVIYQDLDAVAAAQASNAASGGAKQKRTCLGELSERDLLIRGASAGVVNVIKSALAHLYNPENPQSSELWDIDESMARCLSHDDPAYERYGNLAANHGWKFLSKLAHSAAFRNAARTLTAPTWQTVSASIDENAVSLMVFTECCALEWWTELIRLNSLFPPSFDFTKYQPLTPKKPAPHKWVVAEKIKDVKQPRFAGEKQINILANIYHEPAFASIPRPSHWPLTRPYPSDPFTVHTSSLRPCLTCLSQTPCTCPFTSSPQILHPLVELRRYGTKGIGVRALQEIPAGSILDEYLGEVYPYCYNGDPVYTLEYSPPGRRRDEPALAVVSARRFGNWTRFINHSCDATAVFSIVTLGGRHRSVVKAVRDIGVFEEVTVDYGVGYWRNKRCECGAVGCCEGMKMEVDGGEVEIV